jgi:D-glucosaminate-6-phosphate ammonia-lyase
MKLWRQLAKRKPAAGIISRRDLVRNAGVMAAVMATGEREKAIAGPLMVGNNIYESIGVRPIINCKGTFTIISGSLSLPEVKRAMDAAGTHYIHMDELMEGVGRRLAEITQAPWGIVTAGCAAALTHLTTASLVGTDPERMQQLPSLHGLKSEVVIPKPSRNVYDHAIRMLGVKIVEVSDPAKLAAAFNERTAMAYVLAESADEGPLGTKAVAEAARKWNVPVIVDAAAEELTIPNIHLARGATVVTYSGGKCIRGPQCAGVALGDKNLLQAAWANSAPHHAFGRSLKVGKEEIMGMLAAVEMWPKRDHKAEWNTWQAWLDTIAASAKRVPGVTTRIEMPDGLSNHAPTLVVEWDASALGITGQEVSQHLYDTEPRIIFGGARGSRPHSMASSISVMPYMMQPGNDKVAAERLYAVLAHPPKVQAAVPQGSTQNVAGRWDAVIDYQRGQATHTLTFEQKGEEITGTHQGEIVTGDLRGTVSGNMLHCAANHRIEGTSLHFGFNGKVDGDHMAGTVDLGEYGSANFTAQRHAYHPQRGEG